MPRLLRAMWRKTHGTNSPATGTRSLASGGGKETSIFEPITVARELSVQWSTPRIDDQKIRNLYVVKGLTTRETGDALGMSKTGVLPAENQRTVKTARLLCLYIF